MVHLASFSRLNWLIFGLFLLLLNSCSTPSRIIYQDGSQTVQNGERTNEYVTPWEAELNNTAHFNFVQGEKAGLNKGQQIGYDEGRKLGYNEGFEAQSNDLRRQLIDCKNGFQYSGSGSNQGNNLIEETKKSAYAYGQDVGYNNGYDIGFKQGAKIAYDKGVRIGYDSGYKAQLSIIISSPKNQIRLTGVEFKSSLNFETIIDQIGKINGNINNDLTLYADVLDKIHREIFEFVSKKLDLNSKEKQDLFSEYTRIHEQIVQSYYKQFKDLYYARNIAEKNSLEYFTEYNNVELFSEVLSTGICMLVDVGVTFAKSNPLYAESAGIFLGKLCEILLNNVIKNISDSLLKISIFREYNKLSIELKERSAKMIAELAVTEFETIQTLQKEKSFLFSKAKVDLELKTILKLGFNLEEFKLDLNHKKQEFNITISDKPKVLTTTQVPKYLKIETGFLVSINETDLQELYQKAEENTVKEAILAGLDELTKNKAESILKTIFYPLIALPHSQYKVIVKFGESEGHLLFPYKS